MKSIVKLATNMSYVFIGIAIAAKTYWLLVGWATAVVILELYQDAKNNRRKDHDGE